MIRRAKYLAVVYGRAARGAVGHEIGRKRCGVEGQRAAAGERFKQQEFFGKPRRVAPNGVCCGRKPTAQLFGRDAVRFDGAQVYPAKAIADLFKKRLVFLCDARQFFQQAGRAPQLGWAQSAPGRTRFGTGTLRRPAG